MKKKFATICLAGAIVFLSGCKKNNLAEQYYVTANVNGAAWNAESIHVSMRQMPQPGPDYVIGIYQGEQITLQIPVSGTASFREMNPTDIMPAALLSFTAAPYQSGHKINWETGTEINTSQFVIQTSEDGLSWADVTTINAHGTAGTYEYIVTDLAAGQDIYYRLKIIDTDTSFTYSSIVQISGFFDAAYQPAGSTDSRRGYDGNITVTGWDQSNRFITGTFFFKIKLPTGTVYTITDGRFGAYY